MNLLKYLSPFYSSLLCLFHIFLYIEMEDKPDSGYCQQQSLTLCHFFLHEYLGKGSWHYFEGKTHIRNTLKWLEEWQDYQAYLYREFGLAVNLSLPFFLSRMKQFLPWGLWLLTDLHFRLPYSSSAFISADLALLFHFTLIVIADSCLDGRLPKGQVSQRDIITQVGKYLRALI